MTTPEELPRERASDVPAGAEVRADGSYLTPVGDLSEQQRAELLPPEQTDQERELEALTDQERAERASDAENVDDPEVAGASERELADLDSPPREQGTRVPQGGAK